MANGPVRQPLLELTLSTGIFYEFDYWAALVFLVFSSKATVLTAALKVVVL
jgi:hypothetical protein